MDFALIPFIFVLAVSFFIGIIFANRAKKHSDYFLADRSLGWALLTMTFAATQIGGGFILGTCAAAFNEGPFAIFFPLGYCLGFLGLGLGFGAKLRSLDLNTASDIFERYYDSKSLKKIAALLSIFSLTGILIAQAVALKQFLFSCGWQDNWIFLLAWAIVIIYTTQGGFLAVVWTDTVQAVVMIGTLIVTFFFTLSHTPATFATSTMELDSCFTAAAPKLLGYILMPCLFTFIEQDMCQRCFAAKSGRDVSIAGILAALMLFALAIIPVYMGIVAWNLGIEDAPNSKFMEVVKLFSNRAILSCAASAILLAIISTASSLLSAVSSNISQDFHPAGAEKLALWKTKAITFSTGIVALIGASLTSNILSCMVASYELSVAGLFIPFVFAVFKKEAAVRFHTSAIISFIFGTIGFIVTKSYDFGMWSELLPLASSGVGFLIGMRFRKVLPTVAIETQS
jgi:solute:Na+ symporter, SSS family